MDLSRTELSLTKLRELYSSGSVSVEQVVDEVLRRATSPEHPHVWIHLLSKDELAPYIASLPLTRAAELPLFGVPFAIKDNIDLAGIPTSVGCPAFSFTPERSAHVVQRLIDAGAIPIGKTNLDQFATGLVGTRTPYGACHSVYDPSAISGGSSSGSGVAVAAGMVSFSLGTDTAGSGRVPAAFNGIVGLKPSRGLLSTSGVFPACRSLDCVSIFAGSSTDAATVLGLTQGEDVNDPYSRKQKGSAFPGAPRVGIPKREQLEFFGDQAASALFDAAVEEAKALGYQVVEIDFVPFRDAGFLLYQGAWVGERRHAVGKFLETNAADMDQTVAGIISGADRLTATQAFDGFYKLQALSASAAREWAHMDLLLLPTTGTIYTIAEVKADPITLNSRLGWYTNFVNLLDLSAVAIPAGKRESGLPFGITLMAPAFYDRALLSVADKLHRRLGGEIGITGVPIASQPELIDPAPSDVLLAVVGAHLSGQPLNWQLTSRSGRLVQTTRTTANYQLYALANTTPPKPGLVRTTEPQGDGIEVEVWSLSKEAFGEFVSEVPSPMGIGTVILADGVAVKGFLCERVALEGSTDITSFGGWSAFLKSRSA